MFGYDCVGGGGYVVVVGGRGGKGEDGLSVGAGGIEGLPFGL